MRLLRNVVKYGGFGTAMAGLGFGLHLGNQPEARQKSDWELRQYALRGGALAALGGAGFIWFRRSQNARAWERIVAEMIPHAVTLYGSALAGYGVAGLMGKEKQQTTLRPS